MTISLQFLGAARHVTGTKHLLTVGEERILLDCGMVQGPRRIADEQNRKLPLAGRSVDAVVLSHAHIDHCGSLPRLVGDGFRGPIWCTDATRDMLRMMLMDSARIQAQDARYLRKRGHDVEPAYDEADVERTLELVQSVPYHRQFTAAKGLRVEFLDAGHILGAAIVVMDVEEGQKKRRIVFTGDHGRKSLPILRDPDRIPECDVLITESTYGDRVHGQRVDMLAELARIVTDELHDGGRIVVPAFAVGRTQAVVLFLGQLMKSGHLPRLPIYVDSPMSSDATRIMAAHPDLFDSETRALLASGHDPLFFDGVTYVADTATDSANGEFVFDGYDAATRTLTWLATEVTENGSVSYDVTTDEGAAELEQPLTNTACIDSDDTEEDCAESDVFVGEPPLAETAPPNTAPPTDIAVAGDSGAPGASLLLILLALAGVILATVFVAPTPASIRKRIR